MKTTFVLVVIMSLMTVLRAVDTSKPFNLTTILGEKYKNCRITKVTPEGLTLVHEHGVVKVGFDVLSDEWKQQFHYDPVQAREYAEAEQEKREAAEAKLAEMNRKRALAEEAQLADLAAAERKRLEAEAQAVKEYQDSVRAANTPQTPLAPLPGDVTPALSTNMAQPPLNQPIFQTEVVVPTVTPLGDPYTPSRIRSTSYYYSDGIYGGYPFGYGYGFYQPIYANPGCAVPFTGCPSSSIIPGVHGSISSGGMTIHVGH